MEESSPAQRLPGADKASASDRKFTHYLLSENHPRGRSKAKFFRTAGYDETNWQDLRDGLLEAVRSAEATPSKEGYEGAENYEAVVRIEAPNGSTLDVRTFWEVHPRKGTTFLTAYPLESTKRSLRGSST